MLINEQRERDEDLKAIATRWHVAHYGNGSRSRRGVRRSSLTYAGLESAVLMEEDYFDQLSCFLIKNLDFAEISVDDEYY